MDRFDNFEFFPNLKKFIKFPGKNHTHKFKITVKQIKPESNRSLEPIVYLPWYLYGYIFPMYVQAAPICGIPAPSSPEVVFEAIE